MQNPKFDDEKQESISTEGEKTMQNQNVQIPESDDENPTPEPPNPRPTPQDPRPNVQNQKSAHENQAHDPACAVCQAADPNVQISKSDDEKQPPNHQIQDQSPKTQGRMCRIRNLPTKTGHTTPLAQFARRQTQTCRFRNLMTKNQRSSAKC
jgi:hypothetical protein